MIASCRAEIAALKRSTRALEQTVRLLSKSDGKSAKTLAASEGSADMARFSAKGLAAQRRRLGLSAHHAGLLLGASGQSIYKWETGNAQPRAKHLPAIAAFRLLSKKGAIAHLESMT